MESSTYNKFILIFAMLLGGSVSVILGKELCWDLANYHYYNPYAFFHHRAGIDFWPASFIHQFLNPTIDFLSYFLIKFFSPMTTEFLLGAIHGINLWLLFLISQFFITTSSQSKSTHYDHLISLFLAGLGMYGPTTFSGIGSFQNDNLISLFVLGFVYYQLQWFRNNAAKLIIISGSLLGLGIGLKLTSGIYAVGALLAPVFLRINKINLFKYYVVFLLFLMAGILVSSGYWMIQMWHLHHNPLFPFFNQFFQSGNFPLTNWRDTRFIPKEWMQIIFFPFYFSWDGRTADAPFRDIRFLVVYLLFVIMAFQFLWKKIRRKTVDVGVEESWLYLFFIISYAAWQWYFSISRYLAPLEMLAPLVIFLLIQRIISTEYLRTVFLIVIFYSMVFLMQPIKMIRASWYGNSFFDVKLPAVAGKFESAVVMTAYPAYAGDRDPRPQSYLVPFFPSHWRFVGIPFWHGKPLSDQFDDHQQIKKLLKQNFPVYLMTSDVNMPELLRTAKNYYGLLASGPCEFVVSDRQKITNQKVLLCPVSKYQELFPM